MPPTLNHNKTFPSSTPSTPLWARFSFWVTIVFVTALTLRIVYLSDIQGTILTEYPVLDAYTYQTMAIEISEGKQTRDVFYMNPGYPYFLSIFYRLGLPMPESVLLGQGLIDSLTMVLVLWLGWVLFGPIIGIAGSMFGTFYGPAIFYSGLLLSPTYIASLNTAGLALLVRALDAHHPVIPWPYLVASGIAFGLSCLFRPTAILVVLAIVIWLLFVHTKEQNEEREWASPPLRVPFKKRILKTCALVSGVILVVLPVMIRNQVVSGHFVITAASGPNFYIASTAPKTNEQFPVPRFSRAVPYEMAEEFRQRAETAVGKPVDLVESSRYWAGIAQKFIFEHPASYLKLLSKKFFMFWNGVEVPINYDYYTFRRYSGITDLPPPGFGLLVPLSVIGFWLSIAKGQKKQHKKNKTWLLLFVLYACGYLVACLIFYVFGEHRFPVVPALLIGPGFAVAWLVNCFRNKQSKQLIGFAGAFLVLFLVLNVSSPSRVSSGQSLFIIGNYYFDLGQYGPAEQLYLEAIKNGYKGPELFIQIARTYYRTGRVPQAKRLVQKIVEVAPPDSPYKKRVQSMLDSLPLTSE